MKEKSNNILKILISGNRWIFITIIGVLGIGEIVLQEYWGFCHAPLYMESEEYEYISLPNQSCKRFGKRIETNSFSQRSEEPDTTRKIILGLGDSVLQGGVLVDQSDIATSIISSQTDYQMLNISEKSWGPDNCAAYLDEKGFFNACLIYLVVSSHDAYDIMTFDPVVGLSVDYPDKQFYSAYQEILLRYIRAGISGNTEKSIVKKGTDFNPGFNRLKNMADETGIPLLVYLHPERQELKNKEYNKYGKEILKWLSLNNISYACGLDCNELIEEYYIDNIHLNAKGHQALADAIMSHVNLIKGTGI